MSSILNGVNSTANDKRSEQTSIGLTDKKALQTLSTGGINIKKMVEDLNQSEENIAKRTVNNISYRAAATREANTGLQGRGQYANPTSVTRSTGAIRGVLDTENNQYLKNYQEGAALYFNNLSSVYSAVGNLADLETQAKIYDGQNQLSWADQALSESEFAEQKRNTNVTLTQSEKEFAEEKRHNNVLLAQAEAAKKASASGSSGGYGGYGGYGSSSGSSDSSSYLESYAGSGGNASSLFAGLPTFSTSANPSPNSSTSGGAYMINGSYDPTKDSNKKKKPSVASTAVKAISVGLNPIGTVEKGIAKGISNIFN